MIECDWQVMCTDRFNRLEGKVDLLIEAKMATEIKLGAIKWFVKYIPHLLIGLVAGTCGSFVHHFLAQ